MAVHEFWLIRHGESIANRAASAAEAAGDEIIHIDMRDADVPLSDDGEAQARALGIPFSGGDSGGGGAERMRAPSTRVWVSSYHRARQTLGYGLEAAGLRLAPRVDERLRDRELGILDLLTRRGVSNRHPDEEERRNWLGKFSYRPPGGESWADLALRLRSVLRDIQDDAAQAPDGDGDGRTGGSDGDGSAGGSDGDGSAGGSDNDDSADGSGGDSTGSTGSLVVIVAHDSIVMLLLYILLDWEEQELLEFAASHSVQNASITRVSRRDADEAAASGNSRSSWRLDAFSDTSHLERAGAPVTHHSGERDDARSEGTAEATATREEDS